MLEQDRAAIEFFNRSALPDFRVETTLLPEPFVGRLDAPVFVLLLNPGVSDGDFALHSRADFRARVLACHRQEPSRFPNYYLDPAIDGPGARWSRRILAPLLRRFGERRTAAAVTYLEFLPYHSRRFAHARLRLPSQDFTFSALRAAILCDAVIFVTRGRSLWEAAVPELRHYVRVFRTRSTQNVVISERNTPDGYRDACLAVERTSINAP